jgi:hypothetical protein
MKTSLASSSESLTITFEECFQFDSTKHNSELQEFPYERISGGTFSTRPFSTRRKFSFLVISRVELIRKFRLLENGLKKAGTDPTFSRRFFSLPNHIAKIYYSREQIDLVANGLKNYLSL